jgi:hypothetical protein
MTERDFGATSRSPSPNGGSNDACCRSHVPRVPMRSMWSMVDGRASDAQPRPVAAL